MVIENSSVEPRYDMVIVGAGIVGLATAREMLLRNPSLRLAVLDKEPAIARHQSGHNSGVIHSGIYYTPGSLKAQACVAGHQALIAYCQERAISFDVCGKVIVAVDTAEIPRLTSLYERGISNGVQGLELIGPERLAEIEPFAVGLKAIYSPNTGIVDYTAVAEAYARDVREKGGTIITNCRVVVLHTGRDQTTLDTQIGSRETQIEARFVITCAGLYADKLSAARSDMRIVPFRGDYYVLRPEQQHRVRALIYPVPDPRFPFLGVHFTRRTDGAVWIGPNAVLAFAREGYSRWKVNPSDLWAVLRFRGFWKLAGAYWRMGVAEMYRDYIKAAYVKEIQRYVPALQSADVLPGPSGVRAQALSRDGKLIDDFVIVSGSHVCHVQNAPSPAATSSLVVARMIVDRAQAAFGLLDKPQGISA